MNSLLLGAAALWIALQPWQSPGELAAHRAHADEFPDMKELAAIDSLVGSWDLDVAYHHDDGRVEHTPGEWHFAWILNGRAVQDVWRMPGSYGTTTFIASAIAGEIVMESQGEEEISRWIFSDITPESFHWRAVRTTDGGRTWQVVQERDARRRRTADQSR